MAQPAQINRPMSAIEWVLLLSLSVLWGGSFFFNGIAVKELPTLTVVHCLGMCWLPGHCTGVVSIACT